MIESDGTVQHGANGTMLRIYDDRGQSLSSQKKCDSDLQEEGPSSDVQWETEWIRGAGQIEENHEEGEAHKREEERFLEAE